MVINSDLRKKHLLPLPFDNRQPDPNLMDIERRMCKLWKIALPQCTIDTFDIREYTFSELGGKSIDRQVLQNLVEKEFHLKLFMTKTLESDFSIQTLCIEVVRQKLYQMAWICIDKGKDNHPPLFIVHPVSGSISEIAKYLPLINNQKKYALSAPLQLSITEDDAQKDLLNACHRYYQEVAFCKTMEEMALYATLSLLVQEADGPYYLAGYSFGSQLAFAILNQLNALGKQNAFLYILDGAAPTILQQSLDKKNDGLHDVEKVMNLLSKSYSEYKNVDFKVAIEQIPKQLKDPSSKLSQYFIEFSKQLQSASSRSFKTFKTAEHNIMALATYNPSPFNNVRTNVVIYSTKPENKDKKVDARNFFAEPNDWLPYIKGKNYKIKFFACHHIKFLENDHFRQEFSSDLANAKNRFKGNKLFCNRRRWDELDYKYQQLLLVSFLLYTKGFAHYVLYSICNEVKIVSEYKFELLLSELLLKQLVTQTATGVYRLEKSTHSFIREHCNEHIMQIAKHMFAAWSPKNPLLTPAKLMGEIKEKLHFFNQCSILIAYRPLYLEKSGIQANQTLLKIIQAVFDYAVQQKYSDHNLCLLSQFCLDYIESNDLRQQETHDTIEALKKYALIYNKSLMTKIEKRCAAFSTLNCTSRT